MQKWEYRIFSAQTPGGKIGDARYGLDGKCFQYDCGHPTDEDFPKQRFIVEMLNKLGSEGWELITRADDYDSFVFKRPISN